MAESQVVGRALDYSTDMVKRGCSAESNSIMLVSGNDFVEITGDVGIFNQTFVTGKE